MANPTYVGVGPFIDVSSPTDPIPVEYPASIQSNDIIVLVVFGNEAQVDFQPVSGFTQVRNIQFDSSGIHDASAAWYWRRATGSESGTVDVGWELSSGAPDPICGVMFLVRGASTTGSPIDVEDVTSQDTDTPTAPSVTTTTSETLLAALFLHVDAQETSGYSNGFTEQFDLDSTVSVGCRIALATKEHDPIGSTGSTTAVDKGDSTAFINFMIAFETAIVGQQAIITWAEVELPEAAPTSDISHDLRIVGQADSSRTNDLRITGQADSSDERELRITGSSISIDERDIRIEGLSSGGQVGIVTWAEIEIPAAAGISEDSRELRIRGRAESNTSRDVRVSGASGSSDSRDIRITAGVSESYSQSIVGVGISGSSIDRDVRIRGQASAERTHDIRINGNPVFTERDIRIAGQQVSTTERDTRIRGQLNSDDTRDVYITGQAVSLYAQDIRIRGQANSATSIDVRMSGVAAGIATSDSRDIRISGQEGTTTDTRDVRIIGQSSSSDNRDIRIRGQFDSVQSYDIRLVGRANSFETWDVRIDGQTDSSVSHDIRIRGASTNSDEREVHISGVDSTSDSRDIRIRGTLDTSDSRDIRINGANGTSYSQDIYIRATRKRTKPTVADARLIGPRARQRVT